MPGRITQGYIYSTAALHISRFHLAPVLQIYHYPHRFLFILMTRLLHRSRRSDRKVVTEGYAPGSSSEDKPSHTSYSTAASTVCRPHLLPVGSAFRGNLLFGLWMRVHFVVVRIPGLRSDCLEIRRYLCNNMPSCHEKAATSPGSWSLVEPLQNTTTNGLAVKKSNHN